VVFFRKSGERGLTALFDSPIQSKWVPPNCRFEIDDAEDDWTYRDDDYFDFIHARNISMGICDWPRLLSQSFRYDFFLFFSSEI
jgi:hypothetical protein